MIINSKRNCEECKGGFAGGKQYGDYWSESGFAGIEPKGLCEFCNPSPDNKWYIGNLPKGSNKSLKERRAI